MRKILLFLFILFLFPKEVEAFARETFLTISEPIRGPESWQIPSQDPLALPSLQYNEATKAAVPVTWMLRFDAVKDATMSAFFEQVIEHSPGHDLGAFLEITPKLASLVDVPYPSGHSVFDADRIFLSGYRQEDRIKLIDGYMSAFKDRFGFYPRSVGAWHIDSFSLEYLRKKYSVLTALICDDQYATDGYRLWGGYLGSPYIPSKSNVLVPSKDKNDRIDIVVVRWAQRDLFNSYGAGAESAYSVQVNDYLGHHQNTAYFSRLLDQYLQTDLNEFTHVNLGLENDYSLKLYRSELLNTNSLIKQLLTQGKLKAVTLQELGNFVLTFYPQSSPVYLYQATDPTLRRPGTNIWYQSPFYRLGINTASGAASIIDLRIYNDRIYEDHYVTQNVSNKLFLEVPAAVDTVKYPLSAIPLSFDFEKAKINQNYSSVTYSLEGTSVEFKPNAIVFTNLDPYPIPEGIKVTRSSSSVIWSMTPKTPFLPVLNHLGFLLAIFIPLILVALIFDRPLALGFIFVLITIFTVIRSGSLYPFGLGFWGPNGHDAIFHISLMNSFAQDPLDFSHPQISGERIANYHILFDYLSGILSRLLHLEPLTFYFVIFPTITSILLVFLLNKLLGLWKYNAKQKILSFFLVFLSGSLGFIPGLLKNHDLFTGESAFWANQSVSWLLNPPFALSLVLLVAFLIMLETRKTRRLKSLIPLILIGGVLSQTKIYSFALLVGALFLIKEYLLALSVGAFGALLLLPFMRVGSSPFLFQPLWFLESLFASPDRVAWPRLSQAWQTYLSQGSFVKLILVNLFALVVFLVGNTGVRLTGFFRIGLISRSQKVSLFIILIGIVVPLLFIQQVNPWNTIQFLYYSLFFLGLFAAKVLSRSKVIFLIILLALALPTTIGTLKDYFTTNSSSRISYTEARALEFLKDQPQGLVLSPVFSDKWPNLTPEPRSLYGYISTAYISALSGQKEFLSDTINLDITGYHYDDKVRDIQRLQNTQDSSWARSFLSSNGISYIYQTPFMKFKLDPDQLCLTKIFDSGEINIYKFNCHGQN